MPLLKVSFEQAKEIAGDDDTTLDVSEWDSIKHNLFRKTEDTVKSARANQLRMPDEFEEITHNRVRHSRFLQYLERRGFPKAHIAELCRVFKLRAAVSGPFKDRIIVPYFMEGELVTWTGRAIAETHMRYMDLSKDMSIVPPKSTLFNYNAACRKAKVLLVAEGPFDSITADFYSRDYGVRCVALSTNSITEQQTYILEEVSVNFEQILIVMDNASDLAVLDSYKMKEKLATIKNIGYTGLPRGYKDFDEMSQSAIVKFCKEIL
jgi:DNA primase